MSRLPPTGRDHGFLRPFCAASRRFAQSLADFRSLQRSEKSQIFLQTADAPPIIQKRASHATANLSATHLQICRKICDFSQVFGGGLKIPPGEAAPFGCFAASPGPSRSISRPRHFPARCSRDPRSGKTELRRFAAH